MTLPDDIATMSPGERFARSPRPLDFIRIRLQRDTAEYLRALLTDEKEDEFEQLEKLRGEGKGEDDPDIIESAENLRMLIRVLKDVDSGLIELVGPTR